MSSLLASRWAATPPEGHSKEAEAEAVHGMNDGPRLGPPAMAESKSDLYASRWAATPPVSEPADEDAEAGATQHDVSETSELPSVQEPKSETIYTNKEAEDDTATNAAIASGTISSNQDSARLSPPVRPRRKLSWRGKTCIISIPNVDFGKLGLPMPMTSEEIQARLQRFESAGYSTRGFDLTDDDVRFAPGGLDDNSYSNRSEDQDGAAKERPKVSLPDLKKWSDYMNWLTEQKLAALGVSNGFEDLVATPAQDMSRQASNQYPSLPFSPPIPTLSAGSMNSRPGMVRGHSHTMSVASPMSPGAGPFGHMHRHSTFTGPFGFSHQQPQQQQQQALQPRAGLPFMPGGQTFSPQNQFAMPGNPRVGSPAQLAALRQDLGQIRGPGSPLSQQSFTPQSSQDYSRSLMEDQRRRQHVYSQSVQYGPGPNAFPPQLQPSSSFQQPLALPELPEEDDEEELREPEIETDQPFESEASTYVPPHKRAQMNADIAVPTPRGHHHNISEGLERDILEAEQRHEAARQDWIEVTQEDSQSQSASESSYKPNGLAKKGPYVEAPSDDDLLAQKSAQSQAKSVSRFNLEAPTFTFNPGASFQPRSTMTRPQAPGTSIAGQSMRQFGHNRQASSGTLNVAAPAFKPANPLTMPKSEFSFSTQGPTFTTDIASMQPSKPKDRNIVDELSSIFGKVDIPEIVKPVRKSKAIAIVRPDDTKRVSTGSEIEYEDDEGRAAQSEDRMKRQRFGGDDGDEVPRFAEPPPMPESTNVTTNVLVQPCNDALEHDEAVREGTIGETEKAAGDEGPPTTATADVRGSNQKPADGTHPGHSQKFSTLLSAFAKSFEPIVLEADRHTPVTERKAFPSVSELDGELEDGEIREDGVGSGGPIDSSEPSEVDVNEFAVPESASQSFLGSERIANVTQPEPSFDEIDAVMRQLNEAEPEVPMAEERAVSPLLQAEDQIHTGLPTVPSWARSDAPSPSPARRPMQYRPLVDSSFTAHDRTDSGEQVVNGWAQVHRLNKAEDVPASDWSGMLSSPDEVKLQARSHFFDSRIEDVIGSVVERRLLPLEDNLRSIRTIVEKRGRSIDQPLPKRSSSAIESDADDEDDLPDPQRHRPTSSGRDKRIDQIKAAVLEALREQSPRRSQPSYDIADFHSALADMKVSFARAASASLDLEDIRAIVEDVVGRPNQVQNQLVGPIKSEEGRETHKRELSELEGRLNETLAGALEEANHRHAVEEREAETKRMLRLAEEELQLLRESEQDENTRIAALQEERHRLLGRIDSAEDAQQDAEDKIKGLRAENEAMQATLEEYRLSSTKWRHDLDDGKREREELENTIATLEAQVEDSQESSSSMKRRLEKLHTDMATAAGQLMSEKLAWKAREEDYRASCDALKQQNAAYQKEHESLQAKLDSMRAETVEMSKNDVSLREIRTSHASLEDVVQKLQGELSEQRELAARYERDFHDAKETGRAEIQRIRGAMQTDVEAANHQVNAVRAEYESELSKVRHELDFVKTEADTAKSRHERLIEEQDVDRRESLRKINHASSVALEESRQKHDAAILDLSTHHARALEYALEDKQRSESFMTERLALADAKLQHAQERQQYLQERLEVAKSAAQAAAQSAHAKSASARSTLPEKISPQALRESILVLQEQLQEREARIERLQNQVDKEGPATLKERDSEITWLRELLAVRRDDLTDLVNSLSQPTFDRAAVRDSAVRIRANLQMEQQEKDRLELAPRALANQALASLSSFATPKAMSSTFSKWRNSMESSSLRNPPRVAGPQRSYTPSRATAASMPPSGYAAGLMTPPTSNLRTTPSPEQMMSLPPPRLQSRSAANTEPITMRDDAPATHGRSASISSEGPTTPLFREQSYDQDAEDSKAHIPDFGAEDEGEEDDDLDVADSEPPAFRSLESELEVPDAHT